MPDALYSLAILACPVGMGLMMWFMMKGRKPAQSGSSDQATNQATDQATDQATQPDPRVTQLQAEVDQLKAQLRDDPSNPRARTD